MPDAHLIPLSQIHPSTDFQCRVDGLSEEHIHRLLVSDLGSWPAATVSPRDTGDGYDLIDGFHRYEAARRLNLPHLLCFIKADADYETAIAANLHHGLPLSKHHRYEAARWYRSEYPSMSYSEIARRVGLTDKTVKKAIMMEGETSAVSSRVDPISRLVRLAVKTYEDGTARTKLGFGREGKPEAFQRAIASYPTNQQRDAAVALAAYGRAFIAAAEPYLMQK